MTSLLYPVPPSPQPESPRPASIEHLTASIAPLRQRLATHPLYSRIQTLGDLQLFMESHVFAVWDFMSLLKTLQLRLTCVGLPWLPAPWPESRRFINEIVLGEESDHYQGRALSHFELYLEAMQQAGANTAPIRSLLEHLQSGTSLNQALLRTPVPGPALRFVRSTFEVIGSGRIEAVAAAFTFGREDLIPDMFRGLVRDLNTGLSGRLNTFLWYLERHIEIDGEDHGPLSLRMIEDLCGSDSEKWSAAQSAAMEALEARLDLWDGILARIESRPSQR